MKLGFVSAILGDLSLEESLKVAAEEGYDCIEVMCWPAEGPWSGVCHLNAKNFSLANAEDILALCNEYSVTISSLGYYPNPLSANAEEAATGQTHLKSVIDAAVLLGLKNVNSFIGANHTEDIEANLARFCNVWPEIVKYAEDKDVYLGIENCPMLFADRTWPGGGNLARSPAVWRRMFAEIPSDHFGLNLDPSHLVWQMIDYLEPIREFHDRLFHLHAKDTRIEHQKLDEQGILGCDWHTAKTPGLGDIDWNRWISALTDVGYNGPICVEIEDNAFSGSLENRRKALQIAHNVLRPLIA